MDLFKGTCRRLNKKQGLHGVCELRPSLKCIGAQDQYLCMVSADLR